MAKRQRAERLIQYSLDLFRRQNVLRLSASFSSWVSNLKGLRSVREIAQEALMCWDRVRVVTPAFISWKSTYQSAREAPMLSEVANMVGSAQHELTRIGGARPFGVSAIVAGIDPLPDQQRQGNASSIAGDEHKGTIGVPLLFRTDPGGAVDRCDFCAIGKGSEGAITALETAVNFALKQLEESDKHRDDGVHEQIIFDALRGVAMAAMDSDADTSLRPPLSDDHRQGRDGEEDNGNAVDLWLIEGSPNRRGAARFAVARSVGRKDLDKAVKLLLHN